MNSTMEQRRRSTRKRQRRAYSYIRFSTPEQARGRSRQRQIERTLAYCAAMGYVLDETLADEGVSAFRGRNKTEGALAGFLRAFDQGRIPPGSILIIESLDRLSREKVRYSQAELLHLINNGLEIVTLVDRQSYSGESIDKAPWQLFTALGVAMRAHEESDTKSSRLLDVWSDKRKSMSDGKAVRQKLPAWLQWRDGRIHVITERAAVIRSIYEKAAKGWGRRRIVCDLNARGVPPFGRSKGGWGESYVVKLLRSRAVLGEFTPCRLDMESGGKRVPVGSVLKNYFPAVVSKELWHAAQPSGPGRPAAKGRPGVNLFSGLVFDELGAPMHFEQKGTAAWSYLATALAFRRPGVPVHRWSYPHFEQLMLSIATEVDWAIVLGDDGETEAEIRRLEAELGEATIEEKRAAGEVDKVARLLVSGLDATVTERMKEQAGEVGGRLREARLHREEVSQSLAFAEQKRRSVIDRSREMIAQLSKDMKDPIVRRRLARELHGLVTRIEAYPTGDVPGLEDLGERVRAVACKDLTGTRGKVAKERNRVCGALAIEMVGGRKLIVWSRYRPHARTGREPLVLGYAEIGYSEEGRKKLHGALQRIWPEATSTEQPVA
jgi:DNA invertase Pin-like site-specific DNA recombinase